MKLFLRVAAYLFLMPLAGFVLSIGITFGLDLCCTPKDGERTWLIIGALLITPTMTMAGLMSGVVLSVTAIMRRKAEEADDE